MLFYIFTRKCDTPDLQTRTVSPHYLNQIIWMRSSKIKAQFPNPHNSQTVLFSPPCQESYSDLSSALKGSCIWVSVHGMSLPFPLPTRKIAPKEIFCNSVFLVVTFHQHTYTSSCESRDRQRKHQGPFWFILFNWELGQNLIKFQHLKWTVEPPAGAVEASLISRPGFVLAAAFIWLMQ